MLSEVTARPQRLGFFDLPRLVLWTRAAAVVAAGLFVVLFSLDLFGLGPKMTAPQPLAATRAAPATRPPTAPTGAAILERTSAASAAQADQRSGSIVSSLTATPGGPLPAAPAPTVAPLRLASIGAGLLAAILIPAAIFAGRRSSR